MEIREGYALMAYDYNVKKSYSDCLFNMRERRAEREAFMLEREAKRSARN